MSMENENTPNLNEGDAVVPTATTPRAITPQVNTTEEPSTNPDVVAGIAKRLSGEDTEKGSDVLNPVNPLPFDLSQYSKEQIQHFKAILAATPDAPQRVKQGKTIRLRRAEGGRVIKDFKNAFNALVDDPENSRKVYRHIIPVQFFGGDDKWENIMYQDFINLEQITLDVLSERSEKEEIVRGTVFSKELARNVEAVDVKTHKFYTVKLPTGETVELPARVINA